MAQPSHLTLGSVDEKRVTQYLEDMANGSEVEITATPIVYPQVETFLRNTAPAILSVTEEGEARFVALLQAQDDKLILLGSDHQCHRIELNKLRNAFCQALTAPHLPLIEELLATANLPPLGRARAQAVLLEDRLRHATLPAWVLTPAPGSSFHRQLRYAGVYHQWWILFLAHLGQFSLWLLAWWWIGRGVFQGEISRGWLLIVILLILALVPLRLLTLWAQGVIGVTVGELLQKRLLAGALRLAPDEIRHMGVGQLLGRVYEAEHFETLAFSNGPLALIALIELVLSGWVLAVGISGGLHLILLGAWLLIVGGLSWRFYRHYRPWTVLRRTLTHDLVEKMVGHRTRLAQCPPEQWHVGEAAALQNYTLRSQALERAGIFVSAVTARGWLVIGLAALLPTLLWQDAPPALLAISLGGVLGVEAALRQLAVGVTNLLSAAVVWEQIAFLFHAAARPQKRVIQPQLVPLAAASDQPLLAIDNLDFRYTYPEKFHTPSETAEMGNCFSEDLHMHRREPLLHRLQLRIATGDRLLLTGASGSGKSTLAALLTGLREAQQGRLRLHGINRQSWSNVQWRRHIAAAPQFHENHVLGAPLLFNLLMGRHWPPRPSDVQDAHALCTALGLGNLLERMPGGLWQMVGETGWQLSHGERSRLYVARALLQNADLVMLDESFAALDPETLMQVLICVLERAPTLLVIAHR